MLNKLFFIAIVILFTNCTQPQNDSTQPQSDFRQLQNDSTQPQIIVPQLVNEKPVIVKPETDRSEVIEFAKTYLGTTYRYGGYEPVKGFDCSGFVYFVFKHFKIKLPRSSIEYKYYGTAQIPEEFKVGDILVFYGFLDSEQVGHIGIICETDGMKSKFIHASSGKANGVTISRLDSGQYAKRFYKCIDVIQQ